MVADNPEPMDTDQKEDTIDSDHRKNEETMNSDAEDRENEEKLPQLRTETGNILKDWDAMAYRAKEDIFEPYLDILFLAAKWIHTNKDDVIADLNIVQDLKLKLEADFAAAKDDFIQSEFKFLNARTKLALILKKLDSMVKAGTIPDNYLQEWITSLDAGLATEDWKKELQFVHSRKGLLLKELADEITSLDEWNVDINVENLGAIKDQIQKFVKEEEDVHNRPQVHADCFGRARSMIRLTKDVMDRLTDRCSKIDIKEERPDVQLTIQAGDGVKLLVPDDKGQKRRKTLEETREHRCMHCGNPCCLE